MHVVGHYDKRIQRGIREPRRQLLPRRLHEPSSIVQLNFANHRRTKEAFSVLRTDCHKVRSRLFVIEFRQSDRPAVVSVSDFRLAVSWIWWRVLIHRYSVVPHVASHHRETA
jgi:hypothetical protein